MPRFPLRRAAAAAAALGATLIACTSVSVRAPAPASDDAPACCRDEGRRIAEQYHVAAIRTRRFTHEELWRALEPALRSPSLRSEEVGRSMQGRAIRAVTFGEGPTRVLLWSQMHGDEATATMSLADIIEWIARDPRDPLRERLRRTLTITMVPMLNPDGAELFQRENAVGIDVNRDARRLSTPEARALKALRDRLRPDFGFNLHDQNARTLVGRGGRQAAFALLAPPTDSAGGYDATRARARLVAAGIAEVLARDVPGRVAKYDDTFNPRAFGDLMQRWGTSTVLIESGALPDDPEKQRLRALGVGAILSALDAIGTGRYRAARPESYENLPTNAGGAIDVLVRGGRLVMPNEAPFAADLSLAYDDALTRTGLRVRDVGDLDGITVALDTIDATGLFIHPAPAMITTQWNARWLRLRAPAAFTLRRGASPTSPAVRVVP